MSPLDQIIQRRYSPRAFSTEDIPVHLLDQLWEAARKAPSSFNEQPWRFIYAQHSDEEAFNRILSTLSQKNQSWAKEAGVLMVVATKNSFSHTGAPNRHAWYDAGAAVNTLVLKATELDLYARQMAGFDPQQARELLQIPQEYEVVVALALGFKAKNDRLDKPRKTADEFVFKGKFG
ncbi:MAG: nitroreductase family protein [Cyclobacteriaceae bacterium]